MDYNEYLRNNLHFVTNNDGILMFQIIVKVGSINETKGIQGYSHLLEHVKMNKGKSKAFDFSDGGVVNAYTSKDETVYYVKCNEKKLREAIDFCVDIVFNTSFKETKDLETEKKIVYEEMYMSKSRDMLYQSLLDTILDDDSLYKNSVIGSKSDLKAATNKSLKEYNDYFYHVSNTKIVCSCGANKKRAAKTAILKSLQKYSAPIHAPTPRKLFNTHLDVCDFKRFDYSMIVHTVSHSTQNAIYLTFKTKDFYELNYIYLYFIHFVLSNNKENSLLFEDIREKKGAVYNINSTIDSYEHFSLYCIGFNTSSDNCIPIIKDIFQIMNDYLFSDRKMTKKKFNTYKENFVSQLHYQSSNNDSIFDFKKKVIHLKPKLNYKSYIKMIQDLTLERFIEICHESLNLNNLGCYIISKSSSEKELTTAFKNILEKFKNEV